MDIAYRRWLAATCHIVERMWWLALVRKLMDHGWQVEPKWSAVERREFLRWGFRNYGLA